MRWTLPLVFALPACLSSRPVPHSNQTTTPTPAQTVRHTRTTRQTDPDAWWQNNPYVTKKQDGTFTVGNLGISRGDWASLVALPTVHPEKRVDVAILKELLLKIRDWLSSHSGETLCQAVIQLRATCNNEVEGIFKQVPELQPMRAKLDFYTGDREKDFDSCAHEQTFHPLVLCTVDWKRTYDSKNVCVAYGICVAGYTKLVSMVRSRSAKADTPK